MSQTLCPNCQQRFPDTYVNYDELLYSIFSSQAVGYGGYRHRSNRWRSRYGKVTLCAICAARYQRMVWLRTVGWKIANPAFIVLVLGSLFFAYMVATNPSLKSAPGIYLIALPIMIAVVGLAAGCTMALVARVMRPSTVRFLKGAG